MSALRLPKQWLHWARLAGLRPEGRGDYRGFYLVGRGRRWRVNCYGNFQVSCPTERFDRWANSLGGEMLGLPRSRDEFLLAVSRLREESKDAA